MATLARFHKQLAQAEERKNRRIFFSTEAVEVYKVINNRKDRVSKGEHLQIVVDPSPYATMAEVVVGDASWNLTGINHTLKSMSRQAEPTYIFSEVDDLQPDAFFAVIFKKSTDERELAQLESILQRFTVYHVSDRKREPNNPFLPDPDQVIGAVTKGIGALLGFGGSHNKDKDKDKGKGTTTSSSSSPSQPYGQGYGDRRGADWDTRQAEDWGAHRDQDKPRSAAYPWDAVGQPAPHDLHRQDATVGQYDEGPYNPYGSSSNSGASAAMGGGYQHHHQQQQGQQQGTMGATKIRLTDDDRRQTAARVDALKAELNEGANKLPSAPPLPAREPGWLDRDQSNRDGRGYPTSAAAAAPYGASDDWGSGQQGRYTQSAYGINRTAAGQYGSSGTGQYGGGRGTGQYGGAVGERYGNRELPDAHDEVTGLRRQAQEAREAWEAAQRELGQAAARKEQEAAHRAREQQRRDKMPDWQKVMQGLFSAGVPVYNMPDL